VAPPASLRHPCARAAGRTRIPVTQLKTSMPSIKVRAEQRLLSDRVWRGAGRHGGPGATGPLQLVTPAGQAATVTRIAQSDPGIAGGDAHPARRRWTRPRHGPSPVRTPPTQRSAPQSSVCEPICPPGRSSAARRRKPRPANPCSAKTAPCDRRVLGSGSCCCCFAAAGAAARRGRRTDQPAGKPRSLRSSSGSSRTARFTRCSASNHRVSLMHGPVFLLRDDLRDLDGLHDVPALLGQGALGPNTQRKDAMVGGVRAHPAGSSCRSCP